MCRGQITLSEIDDIFFIRNPKPDLHNINVHTMFGENPFIFTQVIVGKRQYGWMDGRQTDGQTETNVKAYISRHYRVVGYQYKLHYNDARGLHYTIDFPFKRKYMFDEK